jgi:c-di-GMP-binding flagellar brake protein YcgR
VSFTFDSLNIGAKIEIIKINDKEEISYPSQVLDIIKPKELIISGPIKQNNLVFIHKDEHIRVSYNVENKGNYYFTAKVLSRNYSSIYTLHIKKISEINKIQLRNHYRLLTTLSVYKEHLTVEGDNVETLIETCDTKDISGGGMKLYCNYEHKVRDEIICSFKIGDHLIKSKALVVRTEEINSFNYRFSIGVSFLEMREEDREVIIKYIFEKQRILRLKGLI